MGIESIPIYRMVFIRIGECGVRIGCEVDERGWWLGDRLGDCEGASHSKLRPGLREELRQDAVAGRGEPRPYKYVGGAARGRMVRLRRERAWGKVGAACVRRDSLTEFARRVWRGLAEWTKFP